jgi:RTX calcium-binding nonapeptide repeat (4 copies)
MVDRRLIAACAASAFLALPAGASGQTSHDGWPVIDGMLLMNKEDQSRPLDARPGRDPFGGRDPRYRCDGLHLSQTCLVGEARCQTASGAPRRQRRSKAGRCERWTMMATAHHHELLGAHGDDVIHAGPNGDVIWGDHKDGGQPTTQRDSLFGGRGRDFIYASHGTNDIHAGRGNDYVKAHFGRGSIDCGGGTDVLYVSRRAQRHYTITRCETISHRTLGY